MKNKKLFAILTLVCFMFTLMPVAAFAADPVGASEIDNDTVYVAGTAVTADNATDVLDVNDQGATFYAAIGVSAGVVTTSNYVFYVMDENDEYVDVKMPGAAFTAPRVAGEYKVFAINVAGANMEEVGKVVGRIDSAKNRVEELKNWAGAGRLINDYAVVSVDASEYDYRITLSGYDKDDYNDNVTPDGDGKYILSIDANNGFAKDGKVVAQLERKLKADPVTEFAPFKRAGLELKVSEAGYVDVTADTFKTDSKGRVTFEVTSELANDNNKVILTYGKAKVTLTVNTGAIDVAKVVVNNEPVAPFNKLFPVQKADVEFKFTDANGVAVSASKFNGTTGDFTITVVEKPANSTLKASQLDLVHEVIDVAGATETDAAGVYTLVRAGGATFDKEGTYVIKVALENGSAATATVKVAEQGDIVRIAFSKAPTTVAYNGTAVVNNVLGFDANGVWAPVNVTLSANGVAVDEFYAVAKCDTHTDCTEAGDAGYVAKGTLKVKDDDYIGEKITVMAVYNDELVATTELTVVDQAATIKYLSTNVEVGVSTVLLGEINDATGKITSIGTREAVSAIVLEKPENAVAVATPQPTLNDNKQVVLTFLANTPGEYKVQTIVTYTEGTAKKYISGIETITVGGGVNTFNDVVVLSINSNSMIVNDKVVTLDVAPFVAEGRTMMQYTALEAFGIDFKWVEETRSVVAEGNGVKVVMNIGSKVATINGESVVMEVAPTIQNDRTVVPVTYITNVFGITAQALYGADGTVADVLFTK